MLQAMAVSFLGGAGQTNVTASPPVLLSASPAAAAFLGDGPDTAFNLAADDDGDGFTNGIEAVLGTDHADAADAPVLDGGTTGNEFQFSFPHNPARGLTLVVQWSPDLSSWNALYSRSGATGTWSADPADHSLTVDAGSSTVTITGPLAEYAGFLRLGVY